MSSDMNIQIVPKFVLVWKCCILILTIPSCTEGVMTVSTELRTEREMSQGETDGVMVQRWFGMEAARHSRGRR